MYLHTSVQSIKLKLTRTAHGTDTLLETCWQQFWTLCSRLTALCQSGQLCDVSCAEYNTNTKTAILILELNLKIACYRQIRHSHQDYPDHRHVARSVWCYEAALARTSPAHQPIAGHDTPFWRANRNEISSASDICWRHIALPQFLAAAQATRVYNQ